MIIGYHSFISVLHACFHGMCEDLQQGMRAAFCQNPLLPYADEDAHLRMLT